MPQVKSAKETIELLDFLFSLNDATQASLADDGVINVFDAPKFFAPVLKGPAALGGVQKVPSELAHLDDDGRAEVLAYAATRFDLPDDQLEVLIEETLSVGLKVYDLGARWYNYRRAA